MCKWRVLVGVSGRGSASKRVTSVTFTFMCPWEKARQERETFFDSFLPHARWTLLIPDGGVDLEA